jgi:hypothetical protein
MVSTPVGPDEDELELEPLPLLQAASRPTATMVAPAANERTRLGLDDIGDSLFSFRPLFSCLFSRVWEYRDGPGLAGVVVARDRRRFGQSEALYRLSVNPRLSRDLAVGEES